MTEFVKPGAKIQQGEKTLLATSFTVGEFRVKAPDFYRINRLDPDNKTQEGFQRILQEERANRLAKYAIEALRKDGHAPFLPTSVFLATEKDIKFDEEKNQIRFEHADVCPFDVVDGQHRIMGLLRAAEKEPALESFPIAVNIAVNFSHIEQRLHFYIVNMTQKAVDPAIGGRIRAQFFEMLKTEHLPYIPSWVRGKIETGTDYDAVAMVDFLNAEKNSPWQGKIQRAGKKREPRHTITEKSMITALKKSIIRDGHPLHIAGRDQNERNRIFASYWTAVQRLFATSDHSDTVVFKSIGALFFCRLSSAVINVANLKLSYTPEDFVAVFNSVRDDLPEELLLPMTSDWWESGKGASGINSGEVEKKSTELARAIMATARNQTSDSSS